MTRRNWTLERLAAWVETVEPKEVVPPPSPSPDRRRLGVSQMNNEERRREVQEWQAVRQAFETRHSAKRRRTPSA